MIYLDNASTSFPKPKGVHYAVIDCLRNFAVSPGRGTYGLAVCAEEIVDKTRQKIADLLAVQNSAHIVLCNNATHALNIVIKGSLVQDDHVLICSYSHNSVIRPLEGLARRGIITYDVFDIDGNGDVDAFFLESKIKKTLKC